MQERFRPGQNTVCFFQTVLLSRDRRAEGNESEQGGEMTGEEEVVEGNEM